MSLVVLSLLVALSSSGYAAPAAQCACASVDTVIERTYGSKDNTFGTLRSPNCLPYQGDQAAINDGRIYAHVLYQGQGAWLLTSDIYIKNCQESFDCVCATATVDVLTGYGTGSTTMATLTSGQCVTLQGKTYNSTGGTWVQVSVNNKIGWIMKGNVVFHKNCGGESCISGRETCQSGFSCSPAARMSSNHNTRRMGARAPSTPHVKLSHTPYYAFIHHGATAGCHTREECVRMIQSYQNYHMDGHGYGKGRVVTNDFKHGRHLGSLGKAAVRMVRVRADARTGTGVQDRALAVLNTPQISGWSDIGYSFVIGEDGNVYEARGWDAVGAHTYNYNSIGLGFCVIGNFMQRLPDQAALDVLQKLIHCGDHNGKLTSTYTMLGHRDVGAKSGGTSCPGDTFYALIQNWPNYNATVVPSTK